MISSPPAVYAEPVSYADKVYSLSRKKLTHRVSNIDVFTKPVEADRSIELNNQVDKFLRLKNNWDGYEAIAPSHAAVNNTKAFISLLPDNFVDRINKDDIVPTPYGTILLEWSEDEDSLTVEIGDSKIGLVSDIDNSPQILLDGTLFNGQSLPKEVIQGLFKLF